MSENCKEKKLENVSKINEKKKHNSKRRRCKNKEVDFEFNNSNSAKIDEIVDFLCKNIIKSESESSDNTSSSKDNPKESSSLYGSSTITVNRKQISKSDCKMIFSSTSTSSLNDRLQSLQLFDSKENVKSSNVYTFPNNELLQNKELESEVALESSKKYNQNKNQLKNFISNDILKEYFSWNAFQNHPQNCQMTQSNPGSTSSISEVDQIFHSNFFSSAENINNFKCMAEYFHIENLSKSNDNLTLKKSMPRSGVNGLSECLTKNKELTKKKVNNIDLDKIYFFNELKSILNCESFKNKDSFGTKVWESQNQKALHVLQILAMTIKDIDFPKYLTTEELQSLSSIGILLTGLIRINQKNYKEAYITAPDKGLDILIEGLRDRNKALEGDEVYFVLKPKELHRINENMEIQKTAVVVGIKTQNHNRGAIGILNCVKKKNANYAIFSPRDSRLPRIRIRKQNWPIGFSENSENFQNMLYFGRISQWTDLRYADGEIVKEVGLVGDIEAETNAILLKYELDTTPYSDSLKKFLSLDTFKISETEIMNREDFRENCVFTIDPTTAKDLDDAVSCRKMKNGNYEVGVHISDVSYFLKEGTPLDVTVSERANTIYLVQKAYHMLPFELCQQCSLTPGEDKLCFSVIWEINPENKILGHRFARTVINSCAQLSYDQVQSIISSKNDIVFPKIHGDHTTEEIKEIVILLHKMAVNLRDKRFSSGALKIDQKKISFTLDENRLPITFHEEVQDHSRQLIEEFMLLANMTVAKQLSYSFPNIAFLRSHPPPVAFLLKRLKKNFEKYGIKLDITSSHSVHTSLLKYSGDDKQSVARMLVLSNALTKPMARARYYCSSLYPDKEDRHHYALNVPLYTHFTSPIRRYSDIVTHRLLAAAMSYCDPPDWTADYVQSIAANCNRKKYAAKMAGEMSTELFLSLYIGLIGPTAFEAVVCDIKDKSFDCIVLSTGAHQRLYFEHIKGDVSLEKDDEISLLVVKWPPEENHNIKTIQIIKMFSIVKIQLKRTNIGKIEGSLLRNE